MSAPQTIVEKLKTLPPEKVAEVEDFVDFLHSRSQRHRQRRAFDFPVDQVGPWPTDLNLSRETLYGDNGR